MEGRKEGRKDGWMDGNKERWKEGTNERKKGRRKVRLTSDMKGEGRMNEREESERVREISHEESNGFDHIRPFLQRNREEILCHDGNGKGEGESE